jgi:hypothetical protein
MAGIFIHGIESFPLPVHFRLGIQNAYPGYLRD